MAYPERPCEACGEAMIDPHPNRRLHVGCAIQRNMECQPSYVRKARRRAKETGRAKEWDLFREYRLTPEAYAALLAAQDHRCAICGAPDLPDKVLCVDHDNSCCARNRGNRKKTCGECTRGLLCSPCNRGLGMLKDNPAVLRAAADYLEKYIDAGTARTPD